MGTKANIPIDYLVIETPISLNINNYLELYDEAQISGQVLYRCFDKDGMHVVLGNQPTYCMETNKFYANTPEGKRIQPEMILLRNTINVGDVEKISHGMISTEFVQRMATTKKHLVSDEFHARLNCKNAK
ncbi:hypothetical protein MA9V2_177 [Chryseobacterium phage MA9V-2]|nr:hypothetical protein MA9V2_177 [Chryseobacterium phage MA9V-2]